MANGKITDYVYLVYGLGVSGYGAIAVLKKTKCLYYVYDDDRSKLVGFDSELIYAGQNVDRIVLSPGVHSDKIGIEAEIMSEIDLGYLYLREISDAAVVGVTGTSGKTTTVLTLNAMLNGNGISSVAVGNVGASFCQTLVESKRYDVYIVELSSFQLMNMRYSVFDHSIIVNIQPNHLDFHRDMAEYVSAKLKLSLMTMGNTFSAIDRVNISNKIDLTDWRFVDVESLRKTIDNINGSELYSMGDLIDARLARMVAAEYGVVLSMEESLRYLTKSDYRFEFVGEYNGKKVYNDSKSTCVYSTLNALTSISDSVCLIVGGHDKNIDYYDLFDYLLGRGNVSVIAIGENSAKLQEQAGDVGFCDIHQAVDLKDAVKRGMRSDKRVILFSPMASSFDAYSGYRARGEAFDAIIKEYEKG